MFTVLVVLAVPVLRERPLRSLPLTVSFFPSNRVDSILTSLDSKQARDLVTILSEAKQQIDPRLHEMARYSGGGGGGRGWGGGRGRGGWHRGGGGGGGYTASNSAPLGNNRRW